MTDETDYYDLLGVDSTASEREVEQAYRQLVRVYRADGASYPDAPERLAVLTEAYAVLTDPASRAAYDEHLGLASRPGRRWPGLHFGLDLGIARLSLGLGRMDAGESPPTKRRTDTRTR